jgi:hypothetical protein
MKPTIHDAEFVESTKASTPAEPTDKTDKGTVANILDGAEDFVSILPDEMAVEAKKKIAKVRKAQEGGRKSLVGIAELCQILSDKVNSSIKLPRNRPR